MKLIKYEGQIHFAINFRDEKMIRRPQKSRHLCIACLDEKHCYPGQHLSGEQDLAYSGPYSLFKGTLDPRQH